MSGTADAKQEWVRRVLGLQVAPAASGGEAALDRWKAERGNAIANLRLLSSRIVQAEDPEAQRAVILVQAIIKNLTPVPDTPQSIAALERYLTDDDIIQDVEQPNPFGVEVRLRATLLPVVAALRQQHSTVRN